MCHDEVANKEALIAQWPLEKRSNNNSVRHLGKGLEIQWDKLTKCNAEPKPLEGSHHATTLIGQHK